MPAACRTRSSRPVLAERRLDGRAHRLGVADVGAQVAHAALAGQATQLRERLTRGLGGLEPLVAGEGLRHREVGMAGPLVADEVRRLGSSAAASEVERADDVDRRPVARGHRLEDLGGDPARAARRQDDAVRAEPRERVALERRVLLADAEHRAAVAVVDRHRQLVGRRRLGGRLGDRRGGVARRREHRIGQAVRHLHRGALDEAGEEAGEGVHVAARKGAEQRRGHRAAGAQALTGGLDDEEQQIVQLQHA